jgi:hypothetical protein
MGNGIKHGEEILGTLSTPLKTGIQNIKKFYRVSTDFYSRYFQVEKVSPISKY